MFSEAQVTFIHRQVLRGASINEVCRKAGSEGTVYIWRNAFQRNVTLDVSRLVTNDIPVLAELRDESSTLRRTGSFGSLVNLGVDASRLLNREPNKIDIR